MTVLKNRENYHCVVAVPADRELLQNVWTKNHGGEARK